MLPVNPARLPAMYQDARQHLAARRLPQAKSALESILAVKPDLAEAHFTLAQVLFEMEHFAASLTHLDRASDLKPGEQAIWTLYGKAIQKIADPSKTEAFLQKAKKARIDRKLLLDLQNALNPKPGRSKTSIGSAPAADVQRAISLLQSNRPKEAAAVARQLHSAHPDVAIIADILASSLASLGDEAEAERMYRKAVTLDPNYPEARVNFGRFLLKLDRSEDAVKELRSALNLMPDMPQGLYYLGLAFKRLFRFRAAIKVLSRSVELDGTSVSARVELCKALLSDKQPERVLTYLEPIKDVELSDGMNHILRGQALVDLNRNDEADEVFERAIKSAPNSSMPLMARASFWQLLGRFDDAEELFRRAIELEPSNGNLYHLLMVTRKMKPGDPLIEVMEKYFHDSATTEKSRMYFGFALAKALEDIKEYERVFTYLRPANEIMRQAAPYDMDRRRKQTDEQIEIFREIDFAARFDPGKNSFAPIFVTGLPRSGTTLVEQIVSSHSRVTGGGELGFAVDCFRDVLDKGDRKRSEEFLRSEIEMAGVAQEVKSKMRELYPDGEIITDKAIQTYQYIGPLKLALPHARIIVVRRDPRDTSLSMYKNYFQPGKHLQSYSLSDLGAYYLVFKDLVDFWRAKTPDWFYEIEYEALIADPETETRKLIAACGLEWEDQCLAFHENKRRVDTLSVHQVRQPIYKSSQAAWRRYESELGELFEALGPEYAPKAAE